MWNRKSITLAVASLFPGILTSCVYTTYPLSNEQTSAIDDRLIGSWKHEKTDRNAPVTDRFTMIGRMKGTQHTLEIVTVTKELDHTLKVERAAMYARPGKTSYLSIQIKSKAEAYLIFRYAMADDRTLLIYPPKMQMFEHAVQKGDLRARQEALLNLTVGSPEDPDHFVKDTAIDVPVITDPPEVLLRFLEENDKRCFEDKPSVLKKI
jgi:hypothetical protein